MGAVDWFNYFAAHLLAGNLTIQEAANRLCLAMRSGITKNQELINGILINHLAPNLNVFINQPAPIPKMSSRQNPEELQHQVQDSQAIVNRYKERSDENLRRCRERLKDVNNKMNEISVRIETLEEVIRLFRLCLEEL